MRRSLLLPVAALAAACATASGQAPAAQTLPPPDDRPLPVPAQLVQTRLSVLAVGDLAYRRLRAQGFLTTHRVRPDGAPSIAPVAVSLASEPHETGGKPCAGVVEVMQVTASGEGATTGVRLACYGERLQAGPGGTCAASLEAGCRHAGDRLLGEIALELVRR